MAWIIPKEDWANNYIPTPTDFNNIGNDLRYLREDNKIINGTTSFTGNVTITDSVFSNVDTTAGALSRYDLIRGSATYGGDTSVDYRMQNDTGFWRLKSNDTLNGEVTLIDAGVTRVNFEVSLNPTTTPTESTITLTSGTPTQTVPRGLYHIALNSTGGSMSVALQKLINGTWRNIKSISGVLIESSSLVASSGSDLRITAGGVISTAAQVLRKS